MITFRVVTTLDIVQELLRDPETNAVVLGRRLLQGAGHHPDLAELARQAIAERLSAQDLRAKLGEWASRLTVDPEADPLERILPVDRSTRRQKLPSASVSRKPATSERAGGASCVWPGIRCWSGRWRSRGHSWTRAGS